MARFLSGQAEPAGGEDAQQVAVREYEHVARQRTDPTDDPIRAHAHRLQRLPAWAPVLEQAPARTLVADVYGAPGPSRPRFGMVP